MAEPNNSILAGLLDRLYAALVQGPCMNCRPHSSRQRVDLIALQSFQHFAAGQIIPKLLADSGKVEIQAKVPALETNLDYDQLNESEKQAVNAFEAQARLLAKLRDIAEDARDYGQETGENALYIGYPLVSIPPGATVMAETSARVLAPLALIPIEMVVKRGAVQSVVMAVKGSGVDLVVANFPLLAWLEQQTGKDTSGLFTDEDGSQPWREINEIAKCVAAGLQIPPPPEINLETPLQGVAKVDQLPKEPCFINAAVVGLFPVSNQGLLRDMKAMARGESVGGPVAQFLSARITAAVAEPPPLEPIPLPRQSRRQRQFASERLISDADPCQARAVRLARDSSTLVVHGPPGTGKSQTITNIIGDHLARGERVLLVCDKRTALDVVQNRLEHLGLGDLHALVHDPQRDQRPLYMKIRDQLENLAERKTNADAEIQLQAADHELQRVHGELTNAFAALSDAPAPGSKSFHDLAGAWLGIEDTPGLNLQDKLLGDATLAQLTAAEPLLREILERAREADYSVNPWADAAGLELGMWLARPSAEFRGQLHSLGESAKSLDATWNPGQPELAAGDLGQQSSQRNQAAKLLLEVGTLGFGAAAREWFAKGPDALHQTLAEIAALSPQLTLVTSGPLDTEFRSITSGKQLELPETNRALEALGRYQEIAAKWHGFLCFGRNKAAQTIVSQFGLELTGENAERLQRFYGGLKARLIILEFLTRVFGHAADLTKLLSDGDLLAGISRHRSLLSALAELHTNAPKGCQSAVATALEGSPQPLAETFSASAARATTLARLLEEMRQSKLFAAQWLAGTDLSWRKGQPAEPLLAKLIGRFNTIESILRLRQAREKIPPALSEAIADLVHHRAEPSAAIAVLKKALLEREIAERIGSNPVLQQIDQERMGRLFQRYRDLVAAKRTLVRDQVIHRWVSRQKSRLLAATGTQLNSDGAALKRRLFTRGERAMKLRQMILAGTQGAQPDPLYDLCPVWMASPGTVALIFPRQPIFDAIIFDEASQCRLEEALPVLTRGRRVVIAGDPKQLPPTRFFESALIESETGDAETEQGLFEQQQGEAEDLLAAALNIETQQCYLDVHYRSRNEALIGFSNEHFYQGRLQPIPGHPARRRDQAPIRLIQARGVSEKRGNAEEARIVADLVAELLAKPQPPSIGIACFNLTQRDVILDELEARCERDPQFAKRFEEARNRWGQGSFEGLFVKNLENVQGDERDHMIISTTFAPDASGKFRRNFGPVGQSGGGRRLNVLVTRAREMIHLITSIPRTEYASLPQLGPGQPPSGRWLLYAYLHYAESLGQLEDQETARRAELKSGATAAAQIHDQPQPSLLAVGLSKQLAADHALSSIVPWGNEGFSVDIAVHPPDQPHKVSLGVLCDMTRYSRAEDPVEWDSFRTAVLEHQGWKFHRIWSPALYSDPARHKRAIAQGVNMEHEENQL